MALIESQRASLLRIARASVSGQLTTGQPTDGVAGEMPDASGVFVTIKRRGELRGCIGTLECRDSLAAEVARCARRVSDARIRGFVPIAADELPERVVRDLGAWSARSSRPHC